MELNWKRIAAIVGFLCLVGLIGWLLYAIFFQTSTSQQPPTNNGQQTPGGGLPSAGPAGARPETTTPGNLPVTQPETAAEPSPIANGGLTQVKTVTSEVAVATQASGDRNSLYYYQPADGHFYRIGLDGTPRLITDKALRGVSDVTWSPQGDSAVLEYPDGTHLAYNFQTAQAVKLPTHWEEFAYAPDGQQLAFKSMGLDPNARYLVVSNPDGGSPQAIEALGNNANQVEVSWSPTKQIVGYQHEVTAADSQDVYFIGLHGENLRSMKVPGIGLASQWTPNGSQLLYSVSSANSNYKPELWIADASGDNIGNNRHSLGLNTWVNKCSITDATTAICAVPQSLPTGAGLAPDISADIPDDLYRINLQTGEQQLLAHPTNPISATAIMVTANGKYAYLRDGPSGRLFQIALTP